MFFDNIIKKISDALVENLSDVDEAIEKFVDEFGENPRYNKENDSKKAGSRDNSVRNEKNNNKKHNTINLKKTNNYGNNTERTADNEARNTGRIRAADENRGKNSGGNYKRSHITINGSNIEINESGRIFNFDSSSLGDLNPFVEERRFNGENVDAISIETSSAMIDVKESEKGDSEKITVRFAGKTTGNAELNAEVKYKVLKIKASFKNNFAISAGKCLKLEVIIPKKVFKYIECKNTSGSIELNNINAERIFAKSNSGEINLFVVKDELESVSLKSMSGKIDASIASAQDITVKTETMSGKQKMCIYGRNKEINASSMSGNIDIELKNTKSITVSANSMSGKVTINNHKNDGDYSGKIVARSTSGNINIG